MKTPEEIKKGLECCGDYQNESCNGCPYEVSEGEVKRALCLTYLAQEALSYIHQLESIASDAVDALGEAERERDAAVNDLKLVRCCGTCVNNEGGCTTECYIVSGTLTGWQWRGVCPENTKEESE